MRKRMAASLMGALLVGTAMAVTLTGCTAAKAPAVSAASPQPVAQAPVETTEDAYGAGGVKPGVTYSLEQMLLFALQDEYLAREEYIQAMAKFKVDRPYSNIRQSEESHIQWVTDLLTARGLAVPPNDAAAHVSLPATAQEMAKAGVQAEIRNIAMYDTFMKQPLPDDVRAVFQRLKSASENHLAAFQKAAQ